MREVKIGHQNTKNKLYCHLCNNFYLLGIHSPICPHELWDETKE